MKVEAWGTPIEAHRLRYPAATAQDIYKLLYQGVLGPEHLMPSAQQFTARLNRELHDLEPDPRRPLLEGIRPDNRLQRIDLRAWLALGQGTAGLVKACLDTGRLSWGTPAELAGVWQWFVDQAALNRFTSIRPEEIESVDQVIKANRCPAMHHSTAYQSLYRPAYRLVAIQFCSIFKTI